MAGEVARPNDEMKDSIFTDLFGRNRIAKKIFVWPSHLGLGGLFNTTNSHLYHYAGNNPIRYTDPDGRFPTPKMFYDAFKSLKDSSAVNRILRFAKSCEYKLYVDFCVGGGVSADALGLGIGGDIGSEHATLSLKSENGEPFNFDYQETLTIGVETLIVVEGSTPTPASARSFTSSTQEESPANGKSPMENMQYSWSYGPVAIDKNSITLNINGGIQVVLGIEIGGEMMIPWDTWDKLWSADE